MSVFHNIRNQIKGGASSDDVQQARVCGPVGAGDWEEAAGSGAAACGRRDRRIPVAGAAGTGLDGGGGDAGVVEADVWAGHQRVGDHGC